MRHGTVTGGAAGTAGTPGVARPAGDPGFPLIRGFGVGVRHLREARGWSQEHLAEAAALNRSYVGEIERGEVTASLATVAKLARAFRLPASALIQHAENTLINLQALDGVWWR